MCSCHYMWIIWKLLVWMRNASNTLCTNAIQWERDRAIVPIAMCMCVWLSECLHLYICARCLAFFQLFFCTLHHIQLKPRDVHTSVHTFCHFVCIFGISVLLLFSACMMVMFLYCPARFITFVMHMDHLNLFIYSNII